MKKWQQAGSVGSRFGLSVMFFLVKILPHAVLIILAFPVSVVYFAAVGRARKCIREYLDKVEPLVGRKLSSWKSFFAFSITLIEKCEAWAGKANCSRLNFRTEDADRFTDRLKTGEGVFLLVSHLGSAEEMRALSAELSENRLDARIPILSLVDFEVTDKFNSMLEKLNPDSMLNLLSVRDIVPGGIEKIQETLDGGGIVIVAGDRSGDRNIRAEFLGETAQFPFGAFYLPSLFDAPSFFGICARTRDISFKRRYEVFIEANPVGLAKRGRAARKQFAESSCARYVKFLERYTLEYPYQWYNFYDFWGE